MDASDKPPPEASISKLPALAKDAKVHKRPLNRGQVLNRGGGPLSTRRAIICVGTRSPFMGIVKKVRHALDKSPSSRSARTLSFAARMAALSSSSLSSSSSDYVEKEVLVRGTGRAMAKTLQIAAWFRRQRDCRVSLRTMSLEAVDDVVKDEDGAEDEGGFAAEEGTRLRMVSCLEVGVSLRT